MFQPITLPIKRPLLSTESCAAIADKSSDEIILLAEDGSLVAFDITAELGGRRCLRVLASSLAEYLKDTSKDGAHRRVRLAETPADLRAEIETLFPQASATIRLGTFARVLNVVMKQAVRIVRTKGVQCARAGRTGRGNSALLHRASCVEWLLTRRIQ